MRWPSYILASWRRILTICVMVYVYNHVDGLFAVFWVLGAGGLFHAALLKLAPIREKLMFPDDVSHGSASFASNRNLSTSGNLATQLATDRYVLGISREPAPLKGGAAAAFRPTGASLRRRYLPVITTRTKFLGRGEAVDDGHLVTVASAGSGKGIAVVQVNLRVFEGPVVAFDPKGENFVRTVEARIRLGHRICLVDPFAVVPEAMRTPYLSRFNPLDALEEYYQQGNHAAVFDEAASIAAMIVFKEGSERDPHWSDKATSFLKSAIMFVTYGRGYQDRQKTPLTLSIVKDCIYEYFSSEEGVQRFAKRCQESPHLHAMAGQVSMIAPTERSSVTSTLLRHTDFLDSPSVRRSLDATDFSLLDLKTEKLSVYLVLPANQLKAYSRLARLWVGTLLRAMMADSMTAPRRRVLFLLDEAVQLGQMEPLEQAVTLGRGYGIDVWLIFQDIHTMKDTYGPRWESFLANARVMQFFGIQDLATAEYVSKKLGQSTIQTTSRNSSTSASSGDNWSVGHNRQGGSGTNSRGASSGHSDTSGASVQQTGRALLQPDEVMRLPEDQLLIFFAAQYPVLAQKCSVLNPAVMQALDAVQPVDAPNPHASLVRSPPPERMAPGPGHDDDWADVGAAGPAQIAAQDAVHIAEREHTRGRSF